MLGQNALPKRIIHSNDSPIGEEAAMNFEDLSPELREKAKACENPEGMLALAKEAGLPAAASKRVALDIRDACGDLLARHGLSHS